VLDMVGFIVKVKDGAIDTIMKSFEDMPHISIYGAKDNQIVLLVDTDDVHVLAHKIKEIQAVNGVLGVYPVFSRDSLSF